MSKTLLKNCHLPFLPVSIQPDANAILIENGMIIEVFNLNDGPDQNPLAAFEAGTTVIDLQGKTLLPGFNDSHMHLLGYGQSLFNCLLTEAKHSNDIVTLTSDWLSKNPLPPGQWIQGRGWNQDYFADGKLPDRSLLDTISTDHPILLARACGHLFVANSKALELAGLSEASDVASLVIEGGAIDVDSQAKPTGILRENAKLLVSKHIPLPDKDQIQSYILTAQEALFAEGITSVQSDDLCVFPIQMAETVLEAFKELAASGRLKLSVYEQSHFKTSQTLKNFIQKGYAFNEDFGTFRTGPLKILGDGSLGGRTAFLTAPYADNDPENRDNRGIAIYTAEELIELVTCAAKAGIPSAVHGIGDAMIDWAIDAIESAQLSTGRHDLRHSIVHCQVTRPDQLARMAALGIHALVQPIFLDYDLHMADDRLGNKRASTTYAFKTMIELGIPAPYGTDCPVEGPSVWNGIQCAVTRRDLNLAPPGGWLPDEAVSLTEALTAYTALGAWASGEETIKGAIAPGLRADLVVVSQDPFAVLPTALKTIQTEMTFHSGELVWQR